MTAETEPKPKLKAMNLGPGTETEAGSKPQDRH